MRFIQDGGGRSLVGSTLKAAIAIGLLSTAAATWLSDKSLDRNSLSQLAADASRVPDPSVTGSLADRAAGARLDPCVAPPRR